MDKTMPERDDKRTVLFENYKVYKTLLGDDQLFITASVSNHLKDVNEIAADIYSELAFSLANDGFEIIHERIFAGLEFEKIIKTAREKAFERYALDARSPFTFIQGNPVNGPGLAGIQIRGFRPANPKDIQTILADDIPVGRRWTRNGATFVMLQNIYGRPNSGDRYHQACDMFDRAQEILRRQGLSFKNVLRTWIYLSNILDWYGEFNRARNTRFAEFGLLGASEKENRKAEQIYLPASTGILGDNPSGAIGVMDVLALAPGSANVSISHTNGVQQKSPYRYGSAFSRAMTLREKDATHIILSGTASIDEHGKTVFRNDAEGQIRKTLNVVQALLSRQGASLRNVTEATIFLKKPGDMALYQKVIDEMGGVDLPAVFIIADVCRDDLLFEIDAAIAF